MVTAYRCFLPDLTGFTGHIARDQPSAAGRTRQSRNKLYHEALGKEKGKEFSMHEDDFFRAYKTELITSHTLNEVFAAAHVFHLFNVFFFLHGEV